MHRAFVLFTSFVCVAGACAPVPLLAQTADAAGARARGMGGAFTAIADDASATWWNPAGVAGGPYFGAVLELDQRRDLDASGGPTVPVRTGGFSVVYPALGLSYYRLQISEIADLTSTAEHGGNRQDLGTAGVRLRSLTLNQFGATLGQSVGDHLVLASTLKLVTGGGETHGGLDIGALAKVGMARFGLTIRNAREATFGTGADAVTLDRSVRAGAAIASDRLTVAGDSDLVTISGPEGDERRWGVGVEARTTARRIALRTGLSRNALRDSGSSLSGGFSLAVRSGTYLDAALVGGSDEVRRGWGLALRVTY